MSDQKSVVAVTIVVLLTGVVLASGTAATISAIPETFGGLLRVPIATSGNNLYMAWPNNDTGHFNVFFAKSTDGGKTFKTMMISAPNKGHTVDFNTQISASSSNVYVTWWTNKTGILIPVFRASNDNRNTFGKAITLNSTTTAANSLNTLLLTH
ncbi:MAG: hypothetical protein DLM72_19105 [Candidatus Nitrosopolaris wilkensis]|nr:MAG: hypothetical protein DLM72_19105 [Candidatus Nitrosopolaris wilkensis]